MTGKVLRWHEPQQHTGIRIDSGVRSGDEVSVYYDPMLAKVIAWGETRSAAIRRLDLALAQLQLLGLRHNVPYLRRVLMHPDHLAGNISTAFIEQHADLLTEGDVPAAAVIAAALGRLTTEAQRTQRDRTRGLNPLSNGTGGMWRNNPNRPIRQRFKRGAQIMEVLLTPKGKDSFAVQLGDNIYQVQVFEQRDGEISLSVDGHRQRIAYAQGEGDTWWLHVGGASYDLQWLTPLPLPTDRADAEGALHAPMPGKVTAVLVEVGQQVSKGQTLLTLEAMKMEHRIQAPHDGKVAAIRFGVGQSVPLDAVLLELATETE
jgi:acetyl/propionyl-CoA carboxylase alpha subunit